MNYLITIFFAILFFNNLNAQDSDTIKPLEIGDVIPERLWHASLKIVNHPSVQETITLNHYRKNKLIILDFWATWCSYCIANMPRTHKLQDDNKDVVFIPVSYEPSEKVSSFIKTNHITDSLNIYSIVGDQILKKYFPHRYLPHFVWITNDGKVRAITEARELTQLNINRMLSSPSTTNLPRTKKMDENRAFLLSEDLVNKGLQQYSIFVKGIRPEYIGQKFLREKNGIPYGRCMINWPLKNMYAVIVTELLAKRGVKFNMTHDILIKAKEPGNLDFNLSGVDKRDPDRELISDAWNTDHLYSFDVILPLDKADQLYEHILTLLNDSTPYHATIEKRILEGKEKYMLVIRDDD